ncbi:hypothetical protein GSI_12283 [Ganoderma sinense ZZ0214-1]|uniref:BTB domain-containing protein n=1 Tax=Ganoderma sinense ZZ0214-1 TaxID=1077348 RepID=A0A2G8RYE4_9APHY|nr:hypothetical protein GSI_12283 [Ganoderma sinense ZZ0214-1]
MSSNSTSSTPTLLDANKADETPLPPPLEGIRRDWEFWIEDGNLILVARHIAFRVYRGLLAEQSSVFADMAVASSKDLYDIFDGCPIAASILFVYTRDALLTLNFPGSRLHPKDEKEHACDELSALARLSHKYQIHDVEKQALDLLRETYVDDFDKWYFAFPSFTDSSVSLPYTHCIGVVNIARLTNTPSLLPSALYFCCALGSDLLDSWKREDGCIEHLSIDDLKRCFTAKGRLCHRRVKMMYEVFEDRVSTGCLQANKCCAALREMALSITREKLPPVAHCEALTGWENLICTKVCLYPVCLQCKEELHMRDVRARRELWDKLPEIFEIIVPGWGTTPVNSDVSA